jgi:divalent metal cation (Fe/Co/Zn/Cd) transporter
LESVGDWPFIMVSPFFATLNLSLTPLGTMLYWPSLPRSTSIPGASPTSSYVPERKEAKVYGTRWLEAKYPSIFTVFLEDSASLIGIVIAFCGILLGQIFNRPYLDPAASILIGILLFGTAALLGRESGALLVGERTGSATILKVERILRDEPSIEKVGDLLAMQLGPEQVLLTAGVRFQRELNVEHLEKEISKIESRIRTEEPRIRQIFLQPDPLDGRSKSA